MTDSHTLLVSYKSERGEPRGPARKGIDGLLDWSARGDCIDCKACVVVCPAGIDIRDGSQLECIQCALCIDACDDIMDKIGRPRGLIGYDTVAKQDARGRSEHETLQLLRPRTLIYAGLLALTGAIMLYGWWNRSILEVNVLPDRVPLYVQLSDGGIRNGYTVKILNKLHEVRTMRLTVRDLPGAKVSVLGFADAAVADIPVATDDLRELRVYVSVPPRERAALRSGAHPFSFVVTDQNSSVRTTRNTFFQSPATQ
jgi:cytochrome c oxidase accessory protein FixG